MNNDSRKRTQRQMIELHPKLDDLPLSERLWKDELHESVRTIVPLQIQRMDSERVADTAYDLGQCCFLPRSDTWKEYHQLGHQWRVDVSSELRRHSRR